MPTPVPVSSTTVLFQQQFSSVASLNSSQWSFLTGPGEFIPASNGRAGTELMAGLPSVVGGALHLTLQTYNPTAQTPGDSFFGSDAYTDQAFNTAGGGIELTAVVKLGANVAGVDGGVYFYSAASPSSHNEIDFELLGDNATGANQKVLTNTYLNEPTNSVGLPQEVNDPSLTQYQTYTIEWFPNEVLWFVDGSLVRATTVDVPQGSMQLYVDYWGFDPGAALQTSATPGGDTTYDFDVSSLTVSRIADVREDFENAAKSDVLIENTAGAVDVGAVVNDAVTYEAVAGLGPEWTFHGAGDLLGDGKEAFLIENSSGAVDVGEVTGGVTSYTKVAGLGPEWKIGGVGDFLATGQDDFLIENTSGAVAVGQVSAGVANYTVVSALGPEWTIHATGRFLGHAAVDFLIENTSGAVDVGEVSGGSVVYTQVAQLGPEWKFVGAGDFLADGLDQFMIENTSGSVVMGEVDNGNAVYTDVTSLGPEWKFMGDGDYLGEGHDQFLIENTAGAVVIGDYMNGQVHFTQVSGLGSEWTFH